MTLCLHALQRAYDQRDIKTLINDGITTPNWDIRSNFRGPGNARRHESYRYRQIKIPGKNNQISAANSRLNLIFWRAPIPPENDQKSHFEGLGFRPNFYSRSVPPRRSLENYREARRTRLSREIPFRLCCRESS